MRARLGYDGGSSREEAGATASAILCSSTACEARLSEYLAHWEYARGKLPEELVQIRGNSNAREQWRGLLRYAKADFDPSKSGQYLRLGCLFQLRDLVAHRSARLMQLGSLPASIEPCVRQRALPIREAKDVDWTSVVFVHEVAQWAVETAAAWLQKADELVPFVC